MAESTSQVRPITAREMKARKQPLIAVAPDEFFRVRRVDLPTLFLEGLIPTPLLAAVDEMERLRGSFASGKVYDALQGITPEIRSQIKELARRCAVLAVVEPKLTHSKKEAAERDDLLWVGGVSDVPGEEQQAEQDGDVPFPNLWQVWRFVIGEVGVVFMSSEQASSFRPNESTTDVTAIHDGQDVRAAAVDVAPDATRVREDGAAVQIEGSHY